METWPISPRCGRTIRAVARGFAQVPEGARANSDECCRWGRCALIWSAWNPGYYYLTRAAVFALIGAGASHLRVKERDGRYGLTAAFLYVTVLLGIAFVVESVTAPPNQIESVDIWYWPLASLFLMAAVISAMATMPKGSSVPGEP